MTKAELIKALDKYDDNLEVFIDGNSVCVDLETIVATQVSCQYVCFDLDSQEFGVHETLSPQKSTLRAMCQVLVIR